MSETNLSVRSLHCARMPKNTEPLVEELWPIIIKWISCRQSVLEAALSKNLLIINKLDDYIWIRCEFISIYFGGDVGKDFLKRVMGTGRKGLRTSWCWLSPLTWTHTASIKVAAPSPADLLPTLSGIPATSPNPQLTMDGYLSVGLLLPSGKIISCKSQPSVPWSLPTTWLVSSCSRVRNAVLECNLQNDRMIFVQFQGKPFNITVI